MDEYDAALAVGTGTAGGPTGIKGLTSSGIPVTAAMRSGVINLAVSSTNTGTHTNISDEQNMKLYVTEDVWRKTMQFFLKEISLVES